MSKLHIGIGGGIETIIEGYNVNKKEKNDELWDLSFNGEAEFEIVWADEGNIHFAIKLPDGHSIYIQPTDKELEELKKQIEKLLEVRRKNK